MENKECEKLFVPLEEFFLESNMLDEEFSCLSLFGEVIISIPRPKYLLKSMFELKYKMLSNDMLSNDVWSSDQNEFFIWNRIYP